MANQHRVVPGGIEPAIDGIVQGYVGQGASALQQQVLVEHKVAFICGDRNRRSRRFGAGPDAWASVITFIVQQGAR